MVITINGSTFTLDLDTILIWALVGLVAGFLASHIALGHGLGLLGDIIVGIIGAFIGGFFLLGGPPISIGGGGPPPGTPGFCACYRGGPPPPGLPPVVGAGGAGIGGGPSKAFRGARNQRPGAWERFASRRSSPVVSPCRIPRRRASP